MFNDKRVHLRLSRKIILYRYQGGRDACSGDSGGPMACKLISNNIQGRGKRKKNKKKKNKWSHNRPTMAPGDFLTRRADGRNMYE